MAVQRVNGLMRPDDPDPVLISEATDPKCRFVLLGDHAGNRVPQALAGLGLNAEALTAHIALDIGVERLGVGLADRLGAGFVRQAYSRLVIDCNRTPGAADSIAWISDGREIPGNADLSSADRDERRAAIFDPYHRAIEECLAAMIAREVAPIVVSLHSFTPVMSGESRPWDIGVLHDGANDAFALAVLDTLRDGSGLSIGDNEPYRMDRTDHTVPHHAFGRGLPYVEIEVRQDVLDSRMDAIVDTLVHAFERAAAQPGA